MKNHTFDAHRAHNTIYMDGTIFVTLCQLSETCLTQCVCKSLQPANFIQALPTNQSTYKPRSQTLSSSIDGQPTPDPPCHLSVGSDSILIDEKVWRRCRRILHLQICVLNREWSNLDRFYGASNHQHNRSDKTKSEKG